MGEGLNLPQPSLWLLYLKRTSLHPLWPGATGSWLSPFAQVLLPPGSPTPKISVTITLPNLTLVSPLPPDTKNSAHKGIRYLLPTLSPTSGTQGQQVGTQGCQRAEDG